MAVYSTKEYAKLLEIKSGQKVSDKTIKRRCLKKLLKSNHIPHKLSGGQWVIEVKEIPENWKHFSINLRPKKR